MIMRSIVRAIALVVVGALLPCALLAHGITRSVESGKAMVVTALYDGGEPISYATVRVYAPGDRSVEFQNGRTDKNGRFAFIPSEKGEWLVRLDDGTGHAFEELVLVGADMRGAASSPLLVKLGQKVIIFLLLAWGGVMTALYVRKRKQG